jgi:hypothetical protein
MRRVSLRSLRELLDQRKRSVVEQAARGRIETG